MSSLGVPKGTLFCIEEKKERNAAYQNGMQVLKNPHELQTAIPAISQHGLILRAPPF